MNDIMRCGFGCCEVWDLDLGRKRERMMVARDVEAWEFCFGGS